MRYLLDTNVISEPSKPRPDPGVAAWLHSQKALTLGVSVLSFGEIWMGIDLMPAGRRRDALEEWFTTELAPAFRGRLLPIDDEVAHEWGRLRAEARKSERELPVVDGLLLATAAVHDLTLVTRNERDCAGRGVPVFNPWNA